MMSAPDKNAPTGFTCCIGAERKEFVYCDLHAAAPALLAALESVLRMLPDDMQDKVFAHAARAAIRTAKGD